MSDTPDNASVSGAAAAGDPEGSSIDEEQQEKFLKVLCGSLHDLPPLSSKIVRIFTSSTFTDTTLERNNLMEKVYPRLKEFCREKHGLEFQVVDMRWGVRDEATDDHMTTELCMQEIDICQRLSVGPNFIVFLGQKYGYRPIPTHIVATEFELLRGCAKNAPEEVALLDLWYKEDRNSVPPVYVLQPISSNFPNFNNKRHQRLMDMDQNAWWETLGKLQRIVRKSAQVLFLAKKLNRDQVHNYFMSVTEREVERGILKAKDTDEHCLAYVRDIANINITLLRMACKFVDVAANSVDNDAQKLLKTLRDERLPHALTSSNVSRFSVEWSGKEGIDEESHRAYFDAFCDKFFTDVTRLIDSAMAKHVKLANDPVFSEPLQHLHACRNHVSAFQGREHVVQQIRDYVVGSNPSPLILHGPSGCGKTSLMAKAASQVESWVGEKAVVMVRFLGTSPGSSTIVPLLTNLCSQLSLVYDRPLEDIPDDLSPLITHFKTLLNACPSEDKPLVLFLDSLDQLSGAEGAHQLTWFPVQLPQHVKVIASTLADYYGLLDTLKVLLDDDRCFIQVLPLGENLSSTILQAWLKNAKRDVTTAQWAVVNKAFSKCSFPLFVKLVFDEICRWRSYTKPCYTVLASTIHETILHLFDRIETQHGKTLVSHALAYITASKDGVSEPELEDLLSLDDKVLNDVYQYHLPPVRRIPPLLWTRIRTDLPKYLSEREAGGVIVIGWYHRQFLDAAKERYFRNLNFLSSMHSHIADYFLGLWGGGTPKPFEYSELQRQRFHLEDTKGEADRKVPQQQHEFLNSEGQVIRYNLRKLSEMPYHLVRSHRFDDFYEQVVFNYEFLHAKLASMPLTSVLGDLEDLLEHVYDKDVRLIADAIRLSGSILSHYPDMLGPQITGRLLPYYCQNPKIRSLIQQCDSDGLRHCAFVSAYHCLHTPSGPLQYSLEGHQFAPFGIATTRDGRSLVSVSNKMMVWDLHTGDVAQAITPGVKGILQNLLISPNDKYAAGFTTDSQVLVVQLRTGDTTVITPSLEKGDHIRGATVTNGQVVAWSGQGWQVFSIDGQFLSRHQSEHRMPVVDVLVDPEEEGKSKSFLVVKTSADEDNDMALEVQDGSVEPFHFHSAIAVAGSRRLLYTCIEISDNNVAVYKLEGAAWKYDRTLGENPDPVFALKLSADEHYLVATVALGYKLWDVHTDKMRELKLPPGIRNIPVKTQMSSPLVFTKGNQFVVAGVRKNLYVWDVKQGNMVKTLDAHFGRIIAMDSVTVGCNVVISSSMDKTIKVWNFDKILEDVHPLDRMERPIETVHLAASSPLCVATTRNQTSVWDLQTGRMVKMFVGSSRSNIVSQAFISSDGTHVLTAESSNLVVWEMSRTSPVKTVPLGDIQQILLTDEDTRVLVIGKGAAPANNNNKGWCCCLTLPDCQELYRFDYNFARFVPAVLTRDGHFLAVPGADKSGDVLGVYHAKSGSLLYNLQLKYNNYRECRSVVAMQRDPNQVAIIDDDKGNILDLKKKTMVRSVPRWNGMTTRDGKRGLFAPARGGLEIIDLKMGRTIKTLIPRVAEGVFSVKVFFTSNDKYVVYYHSGHRTIRLFRVSDGKMLANFKASAEVKTMVSSPAGTAVVFGAVDGSLTTLAIVDPGDEGHTQILNDLPSRSLGAASSLHAGGEKPANGQAMSAKNVVGTAMQVARFVAKTRGAPKSRACVVS
ncbi:NACHT and WD repeat domain-containing protein 2-like [Babylonia areolata]|uniref:NACHT and WD repeat domain-containing protein 2-like n=1 Tax=Babylonia areolata TaxID=304850 RepID=UPI003FD03933